MSIYDIEVETMKELLVKRRRGDFCLEDRIMWCVAKVGYFEKMSFLSKGVEQDNYMSLARRYEAKIKRIEREYVRNRGILGAVLDMIF